MWSVQGFVGFLVRLGLKASGWVLPGQGGLSIVFEAGPPPRAESKRGCSGFMFGRLLRLGDEDNLLLHAHNIISLTKIATP